MPRNLIWSMIVGFASYGHILCLLLIVLWFYAKKILMLRLLTVFLVTPSQLQSRWIYKLEIVNAVNIYIYQIGI